MLLSQIWNFAIEATQFRLKNMPDIISTNPSLFNGCCGTKYDNKSQQLNHQVWSPYPRLRACSIRLKSQGKSWGVYLLYLGAGQGPEMSSCMARSRQKKTDDEGEDDD